MELLEFIGFLLIIILASLSTASGIGGGAIVVPVTLMFFNLGAKEAVAIANIIIFINAFLKYVLALPL